MIVLLDQYNSQETNNWIQMEIRKLQINLIDHCIDHKYYLINIEMTEKITDVSLPHTLIGDFSSSKTG